MTELITEYDFNFQDKDKLVQNSSVDLQNVYFFYENFRNTTKYKTRIGIRQIIALIIYFNIYLICNGNRQVQVLYLLYYFLFGISLFFHSNIDYIQQVLKYIIIWCKLEVSTTIIFRINRKKPYSILKNTYVFSPYFGKIFHCFFITTQMIICKIRS